MKNYLSLFLLVAFASLVTTSCNKGNSEVYKTINVTLTPNQTYTYDITAAGDADDQMDIVKQASHYLTSTVAVGASNKTTFTYTPAENYEGTDEVQVKNVEHHQQGSSTPPPHRGGGNCQGKHHDDEVTYIFKITIQNTNKPG